jgi:hypothetical protein
MDFSNIVVDAPTNWDSENDHGLAVMEEKIHILRVQIYADALLMSVVVYVPIDNFRCKKLLRLC